MTTYNFTPTGYLTIVLHAHLPHIRHPEKNYTMEENWLYEAITETYIPLLAYFNNLVDDSIPFKITMSLTPTLCAMLNDELLQNRYVNHINKLIELAEKETRRTRYDSTMNRAAQMYLERFEFCRYIFENQYSRNIIPGFKNLQDAGFLEIMTCAATHGYLPNMRENVNAVRAQIEFAARSYHNFFNRPPRGIWLPECGYYQGLEKILHQHGIRYIFMESHGLLHADPAPASGVHAPVWCKDAPVAAFARDMECSRTVWSADDGYPGDPHYREFHKDIGFELDLRYIAPYIDPSGTRIHTGIKYHRVTDKHNPEKQLYNKENALRRASVHASDFIKKRVDQITRVAKSMNTPPIIAAPYDAELFGHWWFEGPEWLNFLIRKCALEQSTFCLTTPSEYLDSHPASHTCAPAFSSWGDGGYSHMWLNESNEWIYPHLHRMEDKMVECARQRKHAGGLEERALNQMARELLLAQSSDWAFIMKTGTTVEYATRRVKEHIASFLNLYDQVKNHKIDDGFVRLLESHNNIFGDIDFSVYG
jgi:1,4-alpha-glucan branching enzyme